MQSLLSAMCDRGGSPGLGGAFAVCAEATEPRQVVATLGNGHKGTIQIFLCDIQRGYFTWLTER